MASDTASFDARAATWDDDPRRRALAQDIVAAISRAVPLSTATRLLDIGCGTGLIGLPLAAACGRTLGVDLAQGMIDRFLDKALAAGLGGVTAEVRDLAATPLAPASIDVAVSAMAFHHIEDIASMLGSVARCLAPGGVLAVADLESEDGTFHDVPVPHRGFEPAAMAGLMRSAGLRVTLIERVHTMVKAGRTYPVFLAIARAAD